MGSRFATGKGSDVVEARRTKEDFIRGFPGTLEARQGDGGFRCRCAPRIDRGEVVVFLDENYTVFSIVARKLGENEGAYMPT